MLKNIAIAKDLNFSSKYLVNANYSDLSAIEAPK